MPTGKTILCRWCRRQGVRFSVPVPPNKELVLCLKGTSMAHVVSEYSDGGRKQLTREDYRKIIKHCVALLKSDNVILLTPREIRKKKKIVIENRIENRRQKDKDFFESREWRELRYRVLLKHGRRCMCCGATPDQGVILHVDHVKPRSRYPELELSFDNLQVLCENCNLGKGAWDQTDFRA